MERVRRDLTAHIGGNPTAPQRMLIERAAILTLRLSKLDQKIIDDASFTLHDNNHAVAWSNALTKCMKTLGVNRPVVPPAFDEFARSLPGDAA
jgi:hypothetical protein